MKGKILRSKIFRSNRGIVTLQSLKISGLSDLHKRFYESSKLKNWMCELCTLSQIRSHIFICKKRHENYFDENFLHANIA